MQAIIFDKKKYSKTKANNFIKYYYRTKKIKNGIKLIVEYNK